MLFGAATPAASRLGETLSPFVLAGVLYLGAAFAVLPAAARQRPDRASVRAGLPRLAVAVLFGGMVGPVLLMLALDRAPASTVSLLLNLEVVFTVVLAALVFREHLGRRVLVGMAAVATAGGLLGWTGDVDLRAGALFAAGACVAWALDNTTTASLERFSPPQITFAKGAVAGPVNLLIGLSIDGASPRWPWPAPCWSAHSGTGHRSRCGSTAREVGAARGQLIFAIAPFVGAALSWVILGDAVSGRALIAIARPPPACRWCCGAPRARPRPRAGHARARALARRRPPRPIPSDGFTAATRTATTTPPSSTATPTCPTSTTGTRTSAPAFRGGHSTCAEWRDALREQGPVRHRGCQRHRPGTAERVVAEGGRAALVDLDLERAQAAAANLPGCIGLAANVADDAAVAAAVAATVEQLGGIDLVLAAAGHAEFGPVAEWDAARFNRMLEVHVGGTFNVCKHTLPVMKARGAGSIVTIASTAAFTANGNNVPYGAAKAGITGLTRQISLEALPRGG